MLSLLSASVLAAFPGGGTNDLAKHLHETTNRPVVILTDEVEKHKAFDYNQASFDEMVRAITAATGLAHSPGAELIFHDGTLPARKLGGRTRQTGTRVTPTNWDSSAVAEGLVTFSTKGNEGLQLSSVGGLSRKIDIHWFYNESLPSVQVKSVAVEDFLTMVAKAIGARFWFSSEEYKLDFDGSEARRRAVKTIQAEASSGREEPEIVTQRRAFRIAALNSLSNGQLAELFSKPNNQIKFAISPRGVQANLVLGMIRQLEAYAQNAERDRRARSYSGLLQRVDRSRRVNFVVNTNWEIWSEVPVLDQRGRPAGVQLVPAPDNRRS